MENNHLSFPEAPEELYPLLVKQLHSLTEGVPYPVANLANASALLNQALPHINWVGFYLKQDNQLILGPFQGRTACIVIPVGRGVCGTAAAADQVQRVPDVHAFPGHIACDTDSASEIVIPIHAGGEVVGVLDIDSPIPDRFTAADETGLCAFVKELEKIWPSGNGSSALFNSSLPVTH